MHLAAGAQGMETDAVQWGVIGTSRTDWQPDWYLIEKTPEMHVAEERAGLIARMSGRAARADEVRWELVARLQREIAAGTYSISADEVAGSIMKTLSAAI